jgi:hypothetical protein
MTFGPEYRPENNGTDEVDFGSPVRPEHRRRVRLISLLGVAVIGLAAGGGIAYAAEHSGGTPAAASSLSSGSKTPTARPSSLPFKGYGRFFRNHLRVGVFGPFGGFGFGGLGGLGGAIHGQITVRTAGGGYQTVDIQRGKVTAVSSSSITLKSADGYTATYAVASSTEVNAQASGIATVKLGNSVFLVATVKSGKATAASIIDITSIRSSRGAFGFPIPAPPPIPKTSPATGQS